MATAETRLDRETLERTGFGWADHVLRGKEMLFPFGFSIAVDGSVSHTATLSLDPAVNAPELVDHLRRQHREAADRGEIRASLIGYDATVGTGRTSSDAVGMEIETLEGSPYKVFRPYKKGFLGRVSYDDASGFRQDHQPVVFDRSGG